jgi:hypothetical protein
MIRCAACNAEHNMSHAKRKAQGLCVRCQAPAVPGMTRCQACLDDNQAQRETRRAAGLCVQCGKNPAPPGERCQSCRDNEQRWYAGRKQEGRCIDCGNPARPGRVHCEEHATTAYPAQRHMIRLLDELWLVSNQKLTHPWDANSYLIAGKER